MIYPQDSSSKQLNEIWQEAQISQEGQITSSIRSLLVVKATEGRLMIREQCMTAQLCVWASMEVL